MTKRKINQLLFYGAIIVLLAILLTGWWVGNRNTLGIPGDRLLIIGRLFGFLAAFCILLQVLLMSRLPFIEQNFDLHENIDLHHLNGYAILLAISGHVVFVVMGYAAPGQLGLWQQFINLNTQYEDVFKALIGTLLFIAVSVVSLKVIKSKLRYELWYFMHLAVYFAILLTFLHQVKIGTDLTSQRLFLAYWYSIYFLVGGCIGYYRFIRPAINIFKYRFKVQKIVTEAEGIYSVYITGAGINKFDFIPGQYATWRFINKECWWEAHPFSFSNEPGQDYVRITVKASGDFSDKIASLKVGTPVLVDGPRGSFNATRAENNNVVLIAGGIGLTPYMALINELLKRGKNVKLVYSVKNAGQIAFTNELKSLTEKGLSVEIYKTENGQKIDAQTVQRLAQNQPTIYICGPDAMSRAFTKSFIDVGVPKQCLVTERFAY